MNRKSLSKKEEGKREIVDKLSYYFEDMGIPLIAAKIFSWLLVCDPPHQSAEDLSRLTGGSTGSISTMTRMLQQFRMVERISISGDRKRYWRIRPGIWSGMVHYRASVLRPIAEIANQGLELMKDEPLEVRERLVELHDFYTYFLSEIPALLEKWEKQSRNRE